MPSERTSLKIIPSRHWPYPRFVFRPSSHDASSPESSLQFWLHSAPHPFALTSGPTLERRSCSCSQHGKLTLGPCGS